MHQLTILVLETDAPRREYVKGILEFLDYHVIAAPDTHTLARLPVKRPPRAAVVGPQESPAQQTEALRAIRAWNGELPIIELVDSTRETRAQVAGAGALARLELPLKQKELARVLHHLNDASANGAGAPERPIELFRSFVGNSPAIQRLRQLVTEVTDSEANVLILGESGTGKEVVARNLHFHSRRRYRPFVPVNCGAIPAELLESELFGHEKGAFIGAISARIGRFEMADGGTLFLDEIGDMSLPMQAKLLRVLQEGCFERAGSGKSLQVDVRVIAATHRRLEEEIKENRFREDLYNRLNVFPVDMPPLRERVEDIPLLIKEIIIRLEAEHGVGTRTAASGKSAALWLTREAVDCLMNHSWPGNVRELANLIEHLAILHPEDGTIDVRDLPGKYRTSATTAATATLRSQAGETATPRGAGLPRLIPKDGMNLKEHLYQLEYALIQQALRECDGVVAQAAKRLHLGRTTLVEKLRRYGHGVREVDDRILT
jgi:sigma-54 specific flagellar transcriptional regulator A